jgi:hypothetical protein
MEVFMRTLPALLVAILAVGCGAQPTEESAEAPEKIGKSEGALTVTRVSESEVAGTFATSVGTVSFSSVMVRDDVIDVKFDLGGHVFTSHVDWIKMEANLSISPDAEVTAADRAILQALSKTVEEDLGKTTKPSDNLVRQATLWGLHPEGALVVNHIAPDRARGWTTLCNGTSYRNFYHDTGSHGLQGEYLKYGPGESTNPCRARCGISCYAVGTSAWTVDCGNHDRCEQVHSSGCGDEFIIARGQLQLLSGALAPR